MTIELTCDCGRRFNAPAKLAGRTIDCADCGRSLTIPAARSSESASRPMISARCRCGQHFMAPPELAGKWAKCRACGEAVEIPRPRPVPRHAPVIEGLPAALPELPALTYASAVSTIPARLPPLPKMTRAPAAEAPEPPPASTPRRRKRYKPLYQAASRPSAGAAGTFFIGLALFSASMKICFKLVPQLVDGINKATSNATAGTTSSGARQSTSDSLLTEAEDIASRMEQLLAELRTVRESQSAAGVRDRVIRMESDMQSFLTNARMTRVSQDVAERFKNEYLPRIQTAAHLLRIEVSRINVLSRVPLRGIDPWGRW